MQAINFAESYEMYEKLQLAKASGKDSVNIDDVIKLVENYSILYANFMKLNIYLVTKKEYTHDDIVRILKDKETTEAVNKLAFLEKEDFDKGEKSDFGFPEAEDVPLDNMLSKGIKEILENELGQEISDVKIVEFK